MTAVAELDALILPGDVFLRRDASSGREHVHVILPKRGRQAKIQYMRLGGGCDSTYNTRRSEYGGRPKRWHYLGRIPTPYLHELMERGTLR